MSAGSNIPHMLRIRTKFVWIAIIFSFFVIGAANHALRYFN